MLTLVSVEPNAFPEGPTRLMDLEAEKLPSWLWRRAVCQGFRAMHQLGENGGGYLVADLDGRILSYQKVLA
ncbi:MAG: hypothetical protein ACRDRI_10710 [Pseudonocardiaceae bacterium]